jgi:hypothetical protein
MPNTSPLKIRLAITQVTEMPKESRNRENRFCMANNSIDSTETRSIFAKARNFRAKIASISTVFRKLS